MMMFKTKAGAVGVGRSMGPAILLQAEDCQSDGRMTHVVRTVLSVSDAEGLIEALQKQVALVRRAPCHSVDGAGIADEYEETPKPLFPPPAPWHYHEEMDVLYVSREGSKIVNSEPLGSRYSDDLIVNYGPEKDIVGLQFIGAKAHEDDWFKADIRRVMREVLPLDLIAAVDSFHLGDAEPSDAALR